MRNEDICWYFRGVFDTEAISWLRVDGQVSSLQFSQTALGDQMQFLSPSIQRSGEYAWPAGGIVLGVVVLRSQSRGEGDNKT